MKRPDKIGPLELDSPALGKKCRACKVKFMPGDFVALVSLGPGKDPDARERARAGRPFSAVALPIHYACATGIEE